MESKVKLCKDCKLYSNRRLSILDCWYPHEINLTTGNVRGGLCSVERGSFGRCGVQAIYFEQKTTLASIIKRMYNHVVSYLKRSTITLK